MGSYEFAQADPWRVQETEYPAGAMPEEQLRFLLNYAVLAPSSHNTQPWLFRLSGEEVSLLADRRRALPVADPEDRELVISCGAALYHLRVALAYFGRRPEVRTFPDLRNPDLLAWVRGGRSEEPTEDVRRHFRAIPNRRTVRVPFDDRPVEESTCEALRASAEVEGVELSVLREMADRNRMADLIAEGDRRQGSDRSFRRELAAWMHPNRSSSRDGIPGYGVGLGDLSSLAGPLVVRTFDWGRGRAARDRELAEGSPLLLVLSSRGDNASSWLETGQALARVLLEGVSRGLYASFLNQPVEIADLRPQVAEIARTSHTPQLVLRMGYGSPGRATPRRRVMEVIDRPGA